MESFLIHPKLLSVEEREVVVKLIIMKKPYIQVEYEWVRSTSNHFEQQVKHRSSSGVWSLLTLRLCSKLRANQINICQKKDPKVPCHLHSSLCQYRACNGVLEPQSVETDRKNDQFWNDCLKLIVVLGDENGSGYKWRQRSSINYGNINLEQHRLTNVHPGRQQRLRLNKRLKRRNEWTTALITERTWHVRTIPEKEI